MKGIILAAGKGSRLYPVTHHIAKPLLPIANRPTLHYAFDRLKEIGVRDVGIVVGENADAMKSSLGDGADLGMRIHYSLQEEPKGLAHAMACAKDFVGESDFIMYLGDAIYSKPLSKLAQKFIEAGCANLNLVMEVDDPSRFGVANVDGDRITRLIEKPKNPESNLAMAGVYFFRKDIWEVLPDLQPSARGEYEITDAIQLLIDTGKTVLAGIYDGDWFDTGTLDSFLECSSYLLGGGCSIGNGAKVNAHTGASVAVGEDAFVECSGLTDTVILPGASVRCNSEIRHSIIGGRVMSESAIESQILWGE